MRSPEDRRRGRHRCWLVHHAQCSGAPAPRHAQSEPALFSRMHLRASLPGAPRDWRECLSASEGRRGGTGPLVQSALGEARIWTKAGVPGPADGTAQEGPVINRGAPGQRAQAGEGGGRVKGNLRVGVLCSCARALTHACVRSRSLSLSRLSGQRHLVFGVCVCL